MSRYEDYTFENIMATMMENEALEGPDTSEGSFLWDACSRMAAFGEEMYEALDDLEDNNYPDTMDFDHLLTFGAQMGVPYKDETYAQLKAQFNMEIELGERFQHVEQDLTYYVLQELDSDDHIYLLEAEDGGTEPNLYLGNIEPLEYLEGFESGELTELMQAGEEAEDEDLYRYRILNSFTAKAYAGNRQYYKEVVGEMDGVGGVRAYRTTTPGGAVTVKIIGADFGVPSDATVTAVQNELNGTTSGAGYGYAPIGATVTVQKVASSALAVSATITPADGYTVADLTSALDDAVTAYFLEIAKTWADTEGALTVRLSRLEIALLNVDGVEDVSAVTIAGSAANYTLADNVIPTKGTTTWS